MPKRAVVTEPIFIRVSSEDKSWLSERATALKLRPAVYARMLLSKAVEIDRESPGKLLC